MPGASQHLPIHGDALHAPTGSHQETLEFSAAEPALPPTEALLLSSGPRTSLPPSSQPTLLIGGPSRQADPLDQGTGPRPCTPHTAEQVAGRVRWRCPRPRHRRSRASTGPMVSLLLQALLSRWQFKVCALPHTL